MTVVLVRGMCLGIAFVEKIKTGELILLVIVQLRYSWMGSPAGLMKLPLKQ